MAASSMSVPKICTFGETFSPVHQFAQQDRQGVGFFAGGAAGHPDAYRIGRAFAGQQRGQHLLLHHPEGCRVAHELGDVDQQFVEQPVDLLRLAAQQIEEFGHRGDLLGLHAAVDAAQQRRLLVPG